MVRKGSNICNPGVLVYKRPHGEMVQPEIDAPVNGMLPNAVLNLTKLKISFNISHSNPIKICFWKYRVSIVHFLENDTSLELRTAGVANYFLSCIIAAAYLHTKKKLSALGYTASWLSLGGFVYNFMQSVLYSRTNTKSRAGWPNGTWLFLVVFSRNTDEIDIFICSTDWLRCIKGTFCQSLGFIFEVYFKILYGRMPSWSAVIISKEPISNTPARCTSGDRSTFLSRKCLCSPMPTIFNSSQCLSFG